MLLPDKTMAGRHQGRPRENGDDTRLIRLIRGMQEPSRKTCNPNKPLIAN
jgi:hypothetical protein